jgi:hypothetical protein
MRLNDVMADLLKVFGKHVRHIDIVVDDEHSFRRDRARDMLREGASGRRSL